MAFAVLFDPSAKVWSIQGPSYMLHCCYMIVVAWLRSSVATVVTDVFQIN
jgi:hypothetical protein